MTDRRTATGTVRYMLSFVFQVIGGGALTIYLSRALAPEKYATYAVASSLATWIEMIGCFALGAGLVKLVTEAGEGWRAITRTALLTAMIGMTGMGAIGFGLAPLVSHALGDPGLTEFLRLFVLDFPVFVVFILLLNVLTGRRHHGRRAVAWSVYWIAKPTLAVVLLSAGLGVHGAVLASIGASAVGMIAAWRLTRPGVPRFETSLRPLWSYAWPLAIGGIAVQLSRNIDLWLVKALLEDDRAPAFYGIATVINGTAFMLLISVSMAALPTLTSHAQEGNREGIRNLAREALRFVWLLGIGLAAVFWVCGEALTSLVFSETYRPAAAPTGILLLSLPILASAAILQNVLVASGYPKRVLVGCFAGLLVGFVSNLFLVPHLGIRGAAVGTGIGFLLYALPLGLLSWRLFRITLPGLTVAKCILAGLVVVGLGRWIPAEGPVALALAGGSMLLYGGLLFLLRELRGDDVRILTRSLRSHEG